MDIYLIRHAQSHYNVGETAVEAQHGPTYKQTQDYITLKYDPKLCDCSITDHGVQQSLEAKKEMENIPVDIVIVSPLRRALETCHHIFKDHPSKPQIIVDPLFR
jgi:broad specificity phosphatase PhoE